MSVSAALQTKIDYCQMVYTEFYGVDTAAPSIPWQQIITMLLSLLGGCIPAGNKVAAINHPTRFQRVTMRWVIRENLPRGASAQDVDRVLTVLLNVGSTTTAEEVAAL